MDRRIPIFFAFCSVLTTIKGLSLGPESDLTLQNFTLICNLEGVAWTNPIQFRYGSNSGGGCGSPPSPTCISSIGTVTYSSDLKKITLSLTQSNIASLGEQTWTCSHGTDLATYDATVIAVCSDGTVEQNGDKVDIRCSCGFPSVKATIKYKMSGNSKDPKVVDLQSSTGNSCIDDPRAMNFSYKEDISSGIEELCVSFTTLSQISESKETCQSIACTSSFPCGFLPVWLILILIDVVICILVWKKVLKIGGFFKKKKIIIAIFFGVAIVAVVIGVILGEKMKCPNCGITVVASIAIGLFIAIVQWIFIIFWICKKEFYRAVIKITGETKYTDELGDCKSEAYKNLSDRVIKAIESLYENVEGRQTVMDINFSPGLKVTFDLSSQGFSDCSVLSDTLENALQKGVISSFKVSSVGFEFMPLQDWKDSKGETSDRSNGDRARSPASASAIKVEAENKSHIKPTGKKTEESSLHIKSYGSPLPEVPKVRHNQLDPIPKSDNGEMDNSHNKPYTKLYGSPLPEVPQGRSIPLVPIQGQDIDEMESPKVEKKKKKKKKKKREDSVDNEEDN